MSESSTDPSTLEEIALSHAYKVQKESEESEESSEDEKSNPNSDEAWSKKAMIMRETTIVPSRRKVAVTYPKPSTPLRVSLVAIPPKDATIYEREAWHSSRYYTVHCCSFFLCLSSIILALKLLIADLSFHLIRVFFCVHN